MIQRINRSTLYSRAAPVSGDPHWASVKILAHFNSVVSGAGGADPYVFQNSATGGVPAIGADNGTPYATIDAANPKFGAGALKYPAGNGWPVRSGTDNACRPMAGDFTEEWWQYIPNVTTTWMMLDTRPSGGTTNSYAIYCLATGVIEFYAVGAVAITSAANALVANTWQHVAVSKVSDVTRLFVAGAQVGSDYADTNNYDAASIHTIGAYYNTFQSATLCSFDDWRLTIGVGRYTGNFTPPTAAFPDN